MVARWSGGTADVRSRSLPMAVATAAPEAAELVQWVAVGTR
jgi:hypothetical protein